MGTPIWGVGMLDALYVAVFKDLYTVGFSSYGLVLWLLPPLEIRVVCRGGDVRDPVIIVFYRAINPSPVESAFHLARQTI